MKQQMRAVQLAVQLATQLTVQLAVSARGSKIVHQESLRRVNLFEQRQRARQDLAEALGVGGPEDDDLVELVRRLELADLPPHLGRSS